MKVGLVLGGGGLIGLGFQAGALKALSERGVDVTGVDLLMGTSAGSIIASYLASGWEQESFFEYAHGRGHGAIVDPDQQRGEVQRLFLPVWTTASERVRRVIGSGFAMASSRGLWRIRPPAAFLRKAFPAGLYSMSETRLRLREDLSEAWPDRALFICAAELYSGKRAAFGAPGAPAAALPDAVMASISVPGVFPAVRIGGLHYVDGGVVSATSLDLAAGAGCDAILCIAPLGYRSDLPLPFRHPRSWSPMIVRRPFARSLRREVLAARADGIAVLVMRPYLSDLHEWGTNFMRIHDRAAVAEAARLSAHRMLDEHGDHPVIEALVSKGART
jgi:NTE family protein